MAFAAALVFLVRVDGTDGFSQSLCAVIIILTVLLSPFFIRVTFTYRKSFLERNAEGKNPSALPNSLAFTSTKSDFSSAMRRSLLGQSPWKHTASSRSSSLPTHRMEKRIVHPALLPEIVLPPHLLAKDFKIWGEKT